MLRTAIALTLVTAASLGAQSRKPSQDDTLTVRLIRGIALPATDSAAILTLTNQLAFHRTCANCHEEVAKNRQDVKAPGPQKCTRCHMR